MKLLLPTAALLLAGLGLTAASTPVLGREGGLHDLHGHLARTFHGQAGDTHGMLERHLDQLAERAQLTREQRRQAAEALAASDVIERAQALLAAHGTQAVAIHASPFDEDVVRRASALAARAQEELALSAGRLLHELHSTLTAEQLAQLAAHHPHLLPAARAHLEAADRSLQNWVARNR